MFITPYGLPHVQLAQQGRIKFVAALSTERQALIKDAPAVDEGKSLKSFNYVISTSYYVRKDTPELVVQALHKAISAVLADAPAAPRPGLPRWRRARVASIAVRG